VNPPVSIARPRRAPKPATFRVGIGPGRTVDIICPPDLTESELLILVSSIAGPMREQLISRIVVARGT
jgi:hypothetical protein